MKVTRRQFVKGGVAAFTVTFAAPEFLSRSGAGAGRARPQPRRAVSERRQRRAQHAGPVQRPVLLQPPADDRRAGGHTCCRSAPTASRVALGLHPRLTGLKQIFDQGRLALIQRTGYENQSRSHFQGTDIWSTADPEQLAGLGWVGRYLDSLPSPVDPLIGWNTTRDLPRVLQSRSRAGAGDSQRRPATRSRARTPGAEAAAERSAALRISSHVPVDRPELAFVYGSAQAAMATLDRVATVATYAADRRLSRTPASARRCGPSPARWSQASARRSST